MPEEKNNFILYKDQKALIDKLSDEQAGKLIKGIFEYVCSGDFPTNLDPLTDMVFTQIQMILHKDLVKYRQRCEKNKENIAKRWNKDGIRTYTNVYDGKIRNTKNTDNDNDNDNDNDSLKKKNTKRKKFVKPTIEEVEAYCKERNNNVDAQTFINFYDSKGWKVGNQSMKDWKASVRTWEKRTGEGNEHNRTNVQSSKASYYVEMRLPDYMKEEPKVEHDQEKAKKLRKEIRDQQEKMK